MSQRRYQGFNEEIAGEEACVKIRLFGGSEGNQMPPLDWLDQ